ncbi:hypothetical protein [Cohnella lupini]|uniref:Acetylornithine deacetylase/succinyl-diaminopimelate desuccinylase-like protein n=1 Tax=Cohnella lupini TaxID=1294267 RepID=A0A3D9I2Z6_9BACL|nr:hypothetical protein [Cohnella lupini]RED55536.1 acetylornithine deacetylase/succinyl-diaminopimelate desuccinylase-like protein [Cohnella lupini]
MIALKPNSPITSLEIQEVADTIRQAIDKQELIDLILELGNIRSVAGYEKEAGEYVYEWMKREQFTPKKIGMVPDRFNVIGRYGGQNPTQGKNLLFTSHLDTESPQYNYLDSWKYRPGSVERPEWLEAKLENGVFSGRPVENDRGPMACFLIGAKALKKTGLPLAGTLYLTACPAEIGPEHVEQFQGPQYLGKEIGAQFMMTHGGVAPDFAIAAEGTDFGISWVSCGHANFRIDIYGEDVFTPLLEHPAELRKHPSPLVQVAPLIEVLQQWCIDFEKDNTYHSPGGTAVPKVQIGAIRGGDPHVMGSGSEVCSVYLGLTLTPVQNIADVQRQLEALMAAEGFDSKVEPIVYRQGFEADEEQVGGLHRALSQSSVSIGKGETKQGHPIYSSMWRDHNVFNMYHIPAVTYGPSRFGPTVDDMIDAAVVYATTAWLICNGLEG